MDSEVAKASDNFIYHTLGLHKLESILNSNSLMLPLSATNTSESSMGTPKLFYMSFARTPASGYIADRSQGLRRVNEAALIVFDRRLLMKQRGVSFAPVQYYSLNEFGRGMGSAREAEDRLYSDHPIITNIDKAIVEVRIMTFDQKIYPVDSYLRVVVSKLKKMNIPVKLFTSDNVQGYLLGKERADDRAKAWALVRSAPQKPMPTHNSEARRSAIVRKRLPNYGSTDSILLLGEYVYKDSMDALSKKARDGLYYLIRGWGSKNPFYERYEADLHNIRGSSMYAPKDRDRLNKMILHTKSKTVSEFFDKLLAKWTKIYESYYQ